MAPEAARVEREADAGRERQLADREPRARRRGALQPRRDLGRLGAPERAVVERRPGPVEHDAAAARAADVNLRPRHAVALLRRQLELGPLDDLDVQVEHLAEQRAGVRLDHDVAADLEIEPVQRRLDAERAPVERGGDRQHALLQLAPQRPVGLEADSRHGGEHRSRRGGTASPGPGEVTAGAAAMIRACAEQSPPRSRSGAGRSSASSSCRAWTVRWRSPARRSRRCCRC